MKIALTNAGRIFSGDIQNGSLDADTLLIEDKKIVAIAGSELVAKASKVYDLNGMAVIPGLLDPHVHPSFGDYTERQEAHGWVDRSVQGGVTTLVSAGECHIPNRPRDAQGAKALAMAAHRSWKSFRPRGAKMHAGSVLLEHGMTKDDFKEMREYGIWTVGEIGLSGVTEPEEAAEMVRWAHELEFKVLMHIGGSSIPGSKAIGYEHVRRIRPDVASHLNGGPTALSDAELEAIVKVPDIALELIYCGNFRAALTLVELARKHGALDRITLGNDMPSGVGVTPLGVIRMIAYLASVGGVPVEQAVAMGSGNTARMLGLDVGILAPDRPADLVVIDKPGGCPGKNAADSLSFGNHPSIKCVMIDGEIRVNQSSITAGSDTEITIRR
jgi:enamidase